MTELEALVALHHVPGLGPVRLRLLLEHYEDPSQVLAASMEDLLLFPGIGKKLAASIIEAYEQPAWKQDLAEAQESGVDILSYRDPAYPQRLRTIPDAPALLYVWGQLQPQDESSIAVIGTRSATRYALEMAERCSADLARSGFTVVSGLARGVDTAAHCGALQHGRTIAVIGSGFKRLYPAENRQLAKRIGENAALITEFPMRTPPDRQNFPRRNRIVAAMTRGTLLIQGPERSGSIITMELAERYGRDCFAIPGPASGENFRGNHSWIRQGRAMLVEGAEDICQHYGDLFTKPTSQGASLPQLEQEEICVLQELDEEELTIEELLGKTQFPIIKLNVLLMSLILKGVIREFPGKIYKKCLTHG